jgi:hypothetical protein
VAATIPRCDRISNDQFTEGNPGKAKAVEAAKAIRARLAAPLFNDTTTKPTDFNDLHKLEGLSCVKTHIENTAPPTETITETFDWLAKLPPSRYRQLWQWQPSAGKHPPGGLLHTRQYSSAAQTWLPPRCPAPGAYISAGG